MIFVPATERAFWRSDSPPQAGGAPSTVWVSYDDDGALVFNGDESAYMGEPGVSYEYWVTVPSHQFGVVRRALAAGPDADMVDLVCAHVDEIMARGERTWLDDHGIERGFRSY